MLCTSSEAAKMLKKLEEEKAFLESSERQSSTFIAAINEDIELARPDYDYSKTFAEIKEIESRIRKIKHAINKFNVNQEVPGFDMTIDQILVYIPQLSQKRQKLSVMKSRLAKRREDVRVAGIIEYLYANYDIDKAKEDYDIISDELSRAQTALDVVNNQVKFEIEL